MKNLTSFGIKNIATYLRDYSAGILSFKDVKSFLNACFSDRTKCPAKKKAYDIGFSDGY